MSFFLIVWKNLARRRTRSALTALGVAMAVAAVVSLMGVSTGIEQSFLDLYDRRGADLVVQRAGGAVQLSSGIDEALGDRIRAMPGVKQVIGGLMDLVSFEKFDLVGVIVNGWGLDCPVPDRVEMVTGRRFQPGDGRVVMLGRKLAADLHKQKGDRIELYGRSFEVIGVFQSFSVFENGAVFMPLAEMQEMIHRPHRVTGYLVLSDRPGDAAAVADLRGRIDALDPSIVATPTADFVQNISQIRVTRAATWITSAVALFMGLIGIMNTTLTSVFERTREIGVLRAIGWKKPRVVRMVLYEATLLAASGAVLGCIVGGLLLKLLAWLPQTARVVDGHLPAGVVLQALLLALLGGWISAVYPAWWATRQQPVEAVRHV